MSGNLKHVREMSGKKSCHGKVSQNCSLLDEYLLPKLTSVDTIKDAMSDPLTKAKLASCVSIAQLLEGFLTAFQSNASMAPYLHDDMTEVML